MHAQLEPLQSVFSQTTTDTDCCHHVLSFVQIAWITAAFMVDVAQLYVLGPPCRLDLTPPSLAQIISS